MRARPVGSCREAVCRLQTGCRDALGTPMLPIPGEKASPPSEKKKEKMALMGTGLRDVGKHVKRKGRARVQKKHSIKEREWALERVNLGSIFVIWMNRLVQAKKSLNSLKDVCSGKKTLWC